MIKQQNYRKKKKHPKMLKSLLLIILLLLLLITKNLISLHNNNLEKSRTITYSTSPDPISIASSDVQAINNNLSSSDIDYYSSLSYDHKLAMLFDENYALQDRLNVFLGDDIEHYGICYYNLNTYESIYINENMSFIAGSTYKVGLNALYYHLANIGQVDLNEYIEFTWNDYEEGTGILQEYSYIGALTIQELLDLSLIYSDNIATNMLGKYLGGHDEVRSLIYKLLNIDFPSTENMITAGIETEILKYVYNNKNTPTYAHMIDVLTQTEFNDRLALYLPEDIVAHKIGTYDTNIHDVGIILGDNPYILCIYTNDVEDAEEKIALISRAFYENL